MKFKLKFSRPHGRRRSGASGSSNSKRHKHDVVTTVESWNELRKIGAEARKPHALESVWKENDDNVIKEIEDWDYYIAQFNEQYRQQLKNTNDADREERSISTIAETKSQLLENRQRRMLVFRKLFIGSCLLLWAIAYWGAHEWYLTYMIYPVGFLHEMDNGIASRYFTPNMAWYAFLLNAHGWIVACFGLLCAFCFRESPAVLKQFILRAPYFLIVPSFLIFISVRFVGTFSSQQLEKAMEKKIPEYHEFDNSTYTRMKRDKVPIDYSGRRLWDQLQKILQCCGVHGAQDWDSVDDDLNDPISYWPLTCCPKPFVRRLWTKERPVRDDCFSKINKMLNTEEYEWAYPQGCLNLAYEFFVKLGAFLVGIMFANFCALCLCLTFAFKYYVLVMKTEQLKFKFSFKQWVAEIFFLHHFACVVNGCKKICKKPKDHDKKSKHKSVASGTNVSQMSQDSVGTIPSVVITAPKEGVQNDDEDPGSVNDFHVLFSDPEAKLEPEPEPEDLDIPANVLMIDETYNEE